MKKAISSLSLEDLFAPAPTGSLPKPAAPSREEREALIAKAAEAAKAKRAIPLWRSTRVVLWMQQIECACGYTHFAPASEGVTVEFTHIRNPETKHYVSNHPAAMNPNLPKEIEYRVSHSHSCHECFPLPDSTIEPYVYTPSHKDKI